MTVLRSVVPGKEAHARWPAASALWFRHLVITRSRSPSPRVPSLPLLCWPRGSPACLCGLSCSDISFEWDPPCGLPRLASFLWLFKHVIPGKGKSQRSPEWIPKSFQGPRKGYFIPTQKRNQGLSCPLPLGLLAFEQGVVWPPGPLSLASSLIYC